MASDDDVCVVPGCLDDAEYTSPKRWCARHWRMWWDHGVETPDVPEPKWMRLDEDEEGVHD